MIRFPFPGSHRSHAASAITALLLLSACGQGETAPTSSGSGGGGASTSSTTTGSSGTGGSLPTAPLTIVDWNTHNYFDSKKNGTDPGEIILSAADYATKRKTIGAELKALAGDIVLLTEIENLAILDDLNKTELGGAYGNTVLIRGNDPRGIDVGMLTKVAPDLVVSHKDDLFVKAGTNGPQYRYSRDCLEVHVTFNQRKVIVLGVHFKAKAAPDDPDKRLAEAQHTRALADALQAKEPDAAIVVLGDYNDTPDSAPYAAVHGAAPTLFVDASDAVAVAQRYSYDFNGKLELIDHQMANPRLAALLDPTSVVIAHGKGIDDSTKYSSDHAPIKATYLVR